HVALNKLRNVEVVEAAVSDRNGRSFMEGSGATGHLSTAGTPIETVTLDRYPVPDLVKMDIEGAELAALRACPELIAKRRTTWFVELHDPNHRFVPNLFASGYTVDWHRGDICAQPLAA